jgi:hypothetical protein
MILLIIEQLWLPCRLIIVVSLPSCCANIANLLSMRHSLPTFWIIVARLPLPHSCGIMLLTKQCETTQGLINAALIAILPLRHHCQIAFAPTGTCDTIIILQHSFVASASNLLTRIHFLQIMLNVHSLYRFVVNHTRPFSYIMRTPVLLTLFTSLLLGIIVLNHRSLLQGIQVSL